MRNAKSALTWPLVPMAYKSMQLADNSSPAARRTTSAGSSAGSRRRDSCSSRSTARVTSSAGVAASKGKLQSGSGAAPGTASRYSSALNAFKLRQPNFRQKRVTAAGLVKLAAASSRALIRAACSGFCRI